MYLSDDQYEEQTMVAPDRIVPLAHAFVFRKGKYPLRTS